MEWNFLGHKISITGDGIFVAEVEGKEIRQDTLSGCEKEISRELKQLEIRREYQEKMARLNNATAPNIQAVPHRLMSVPQTALYLGMSPRSIWNWVYTRVIPSIKLGGSVRIDRNDLDELLLQRKTPALTEPKARVSNLSPKPGSYKNKSVRDSFPIDSGMPIPARASKNAGSYRRPEMNDLPGGRMNFDGMKSGDSFFAPNIKLERIAPAAWQWKIRLGLKDAEFTYRLVREKGIWGTRVWRIK
jgi:excisionase family DNA binding protein